MSNASDSQLSLQVALSTGTAKLGDIVTLSLQATHPSGILIQPSALNKDLGTFEIQASTELPVETSGAQQVQRFVFQLQNFTTGQQVLPGIEFSYVGGDHKKHAFKSPELKVAIEMVPPGSKDKGDIRGIKGVIGPVGISPWWWLLLVFAVLIGGICYWKNRQRVIQGQPPPPPVPPDEIALEKLRGLLESGWVESGKLKEFYSGVSDTVRAYVETGFACPALERTTGELMRDLRKRAVFDSTRLIQLKALLDDCDLVKFAKFRPDAEESLKAHAQAVQFVEGTRAALKNSAAITR